MMVDRYSAHPLAADAYRWLIRHASSSEARRRHELGQSFRARIVGRLCQTPSVGSAFHRNALQILYALLNSCDLPRYS